jgi:hypothetical protein
MHDGHTRFSNAGETSRTRSIELFSSRRHEPRLHGTPVRSSLKSKSACSPTHDESDRTTDYSDRTTLGSAETHDDPTELDHTDSGRAPLKKKRRASWDPDMVTVHHVHDTHYRRTWCKRHRHVVCTLLSLGTSFCLILAAIVAIWGLR